MNVLQFRYDSDNLGYLIHDGKEAVAIDPGDPGFVLDYIRREGLQLKKIRNTHSHSDHTSGNRILAARTAASIMDSPGTTLFYVGEEKVEVIPTPGHTRDSVCFKGNGWIITGDTLFIANVGNCIPGLVGEFRDSLTRLLELPNDTVIYPGHDYTDRSLRRAREIEPDNPDIKQFRESYNPPPIVSTIGSEKRINPYLRTDEPAVIDYLKESEKDAKTSFSRFQSFLLE
ncbi:MAG: hydroxyacylglutathione hydrolase [Candidatus Auribacterota bacterium]|nr:hydroxyacylglutathione hydrolase [Candidatus Auribacterota bacterium]